MRLKVIACKVLTREIGALSAQCPNFLDITWIRQGYHDEPEKLHQILQQQIDLIDQGDDPYSCSPEAGDFDAIVLGYGLCSGGTMGLKSQKYPLVIPRAHDCITLFLGSKDRYRELFDQHSGGLYWFTPGWVENCLMPSQKRYEQTLALYTKKYGAENAQYLMKMEQSWFTRYHSAAYLQLPGVSNVSYRAFTEECADYLNWDYEEFLGDDRLLKNMLWGEFNPEDFLVVPAGNTARQSYKKDIIELAE